MWVKRTGKTTEIYLGQSVFVKESTKKNVSIGFSKADKSPIFLCVIRSYINISYGRLLAYYREGFDACMFWPLNLWSLCCEYAGKRITRSRWIVTSFPTAVITNTTRRVSNQSVDCDVKACVLISVLSSCSMVLLCGSSALRIMRFRRPSVRLSVCVLLSRIGAPNSQTKNVYKKRKWCKCTLGQE